MADAKISALTNLTAADAINDMIPIVDVSDTPPASGNTKRISINNLLSSSPTASGAFTITGALDAARLNVTGATIPANGVYLGSANNLSFSANSTLGMTLNSTGLGVGGSPVTSHLISAQGPIAFGSTAGGTRTSYIANSAAASIYYTDGGASYPFNDFGNLVIQPRTSAARSVIIATGSTTPVERAVVKSTGQVRFVPLAADPAGAESGDVYYNSVSNKLKCYNGTTWNDLF